MKLVWTLLLCILTPALFAQTIREDIVSKRLLKRIHEDPAGYYSFYIALKDKVDAVALNQNLRSRKAGLAQRSMEVNTILKAKAAATQGPIIAFLEQSAGVEPSSIHPYWVTNLIFVKANASVIANLSQRADIAFLDWNAPLATSAHAEAFSMGTATQPGGKEPGLAAINAPAMWAMGYSGYGRTALTNDTGVDPGHPALAAKYRGFYTGPGEAWYEFNSSLKDPYDCDSHGTHVTGTMMGLDRITHDTICVAFNSTWMGCSTIGCGNAGFNEDQIGAFQWSLDPDGDPDTFEDMPDAVNNSWYDPTTEDDCTSVYVDLLNALDAAGIAVIFSAGNEGPAEMTISPPHNINTDVVNSFTVGALNGNISTLPIANFSSRGPSNCGGEGSLLIKPEVSAPGESVRSSVSGIGYAYYNGTSMAAPHATGAVLLLKEAFPYLPGHELKLALYHTCTDLGDPGEDNTYGMGIINVEAAFYYLIAQGNVPAPPVVNNTDALIVLVKSREYNCEEVVTGQVIVQNDGLTTINSMEISMVVGTESTQFSWSGTLEPGEYVSIDLPSMSIAEGKNHLEVEILTVNGAPDDRYLNNRFVLPVKVEDRSYLDAALDLGPDMNVCDSAVVALRASYDGPGAVTFQWYDAPEDGNLLGEGPVFLAGPLTSDTVFFADATYTDKVGLENREDGNWELGPDPDGEGIVFDAYAPFKIKTVKMYTEVAGPRIIQLQDENGKAIKTKTLVVNHVGEGVVTLNMTIPEGENLRLVLDYGIPLIYNTSGLDFPYTVKDILEIKRSTGPNGSQKWYYFYDWEIEYEEICGRTPVEVSLGGTGAMPVVDFTISQDTIVLVGGNAAIDFTEQAAGTTSWFWNFGDGTTTAEQNPSHTYTQPGAYTVSLSASDAVGCAASAFKTVVVEALISSTSEPASDATLRLYPNPTRDYLQVEWEGPASELQVFDLQGREVWRQSLSGQHTQLQLNGWTNGLYFVRMQTDKGMVTAKFQVIR
ncbi:MAG: S8 family serine peptidase [Saprospirales bacterium]|nr:S8 family serine peptidase [Saprospirales bacterium]